MNVGIVTCIRANDVCTGSACLDAFYDKTASFSRYGRDVRLGAFMTCNDCRDRQPLEPEEDPGIQEKLECLVNKKIEIMHVGVCSWFENENQEWSLCPRMSKICRMMEESGIRVVQGTHKGRVPFL